MAADSSGASSLMKSVREEVVMSTYSVTMIAGTVLMLGNMSRNLHLGNPLSIPHSVLYLAFLVTYVLRRRIGARWLAPILLVALYLAGTFGYFIYGFVGNSAPLYMTLCIVAASFYGPRGGLIAAFASGAMMIVAAALAMSGYLVFGFDMKAFISSPFSWIAALTTFAAMAAMALTQVGLMHRKLESLLHDQHARMRELAQTNCRLEEEIAARTRIEAEQRRQSALLNSILASLPQGISVYDRQLKLLLCNDALAGVLDLPREFLAGKPNFDEVIGIRARRGDYGPGDPEQLVRDRRQRILTFNRHSYERALPSGRTYLVAAEPFSVDGEVAGLVTTYTDITERKQSEQELQRLHERISLALKTVGIGIFDWDAATNRLTADQRMFEISGISGAGRNGAFDDWRDYLHQDDRERIVHELDDLLRGTATDSKLAYRNIRPDGRVGYCEVYHHIVRNPAGRVLRIVGAVLDVTERMETGKRLLLAETAFDNSPVAIMITDQANRIVSVNTSFERITGHATADAVGRDPGFLASGLHDADFFSRMWQSLHDTGSWEGEVWNRHKSGEIHPVWLSINMVRDRHHPEQSYYLSIFSDITERKQAEEHIRHLAHHDPLTTLPNRIALEARLEQSFAEAQRNQRSVAVLFADLDHFKTINDTLGHSVGDLLLIEVARRLRQTVRAADTVARLGGDEFVVVLAALETPEVASTVADGILEALSRPYTIEGRILHCTPSIGIAIYPQDGSDFVTVMKYADTAMYHAKDSGRACFKFFSPELNRVAMERLDMERQLRDALKLGQLVVHYQPRVDRAKNVTGAEALIRWNRPGHGLQLPDRFIAIAEESELVVSIGDWVLAAVARQLRDWLDAGMETPAVAINLSARQLRLASLPVKIAETLRDNKLPSRLLEFEVTESMAMDSPEHASRLLKELRAMDIAVSLDDFGTGYSSLAYLKHLPFSHLKIDRSFVAGITHGLHDLAIVRGTVALAHSIGLKVVAEGVETAEQFALLLDTGCDEFQGFLFSQPLPARELEAFLGFPPPDTAQP